jgi:molybdopterin-guanine dinucleotide biosynthesis protein A
VVLAGGAGRRLGGRRKPVLAVAGTPMLLRVLAAVAVAEPRVVVGPPELAGMLPAVVRLTSEQPPGGGPVAALAAGLDALGAHADGGALVAVLAADLPLLTAEAIARLDAALGAGADGGGADGARAVDGAVYVDGDGRPQWLCGLWRRQRLAAGLADVAATGPLAGRSLGALLGPLRAALVAGPADGPPPWYDCDTPADLSAAERLREEET